MPAGTKNGSSDRANRRNTPRDRKWSRTSRGTRRPTIVDRLASSTSSCPDWHQASALASRRRRRLRGKCWGAGSSAFGAGAVGSEARLDSVVVGEPALVAGLLCASAKPGQVLLTGKSLAHIGARFDVNPLGERALQKVRAAVFEVLDEDSSSGTLSGVP